MTPFKTGIEDRAARAALARLAAAGAALAPAMQDMGELLSETTKRRFASKTAPEGPAWARNGPVTIERKGRDDPLLGGRARLSGAIFWRAGPLSRLPPAAGGPRAPAP